MIKDVIFYFTCFLMDLNARWQPFTVKDFDTLDPIVFTPKAPFVRAFLT